MVNDLNEDFNRYNLEGLDDDFEDFQGLENSYYYPPEEEDQDDDYRNNLEMEDSYSDEFEEDDEQGS